MNGIIKPRAINTTPRSCPKPTEEVAVVTTPVIEETITTVESSTKKKQNIKPQSGKSND